MSSRLSNKYITNLELKRPIVDDRPKALRMFSTIAKSGTPKLSIYDGWVLSGDKKQTDKNCGEWMNLACLKSHSSENEIYGKAKKAKSVRIIVY